MGGMPYWYVVDYEEPLQSALDRLRTRELEAGRYYPVLPFPQDDPTATPGKAHPNIKAALKAAGADGTKSILDISTIADKPDYCVAAPFAPNDLEKIFGTTQPEPAAFESDPPSEVFDAIERGMARYIIGYEAGRPRKILFVGYSFD
jgi:hypothetical protein